MTKPSNRQAADQTEPLTGEILEPRQTEGQAMGELRRIHKAEPEPLQAPTWESFSREEVAKHRAAMTAKVMKELAADAIVGTVELAQLIKDQGIDDPIVANLLLRHLVNYSGSADQALAQYRDRDRR